MDSMTVTVALSALCGANVALIWQVSRLADRVRNAGHELHGMEIVMMRMLRKELENYGEEA